MSVEKVRAYLTPYGVAQRIRELEVSSATVELAAAALGVAPARIAKTLSFKVGERPILVVAAGDARIDNSKYKHFFGVKARMLTPEEAVERIGHAVGGVCPFARRRYQWLTADVTGTDPLEALRRELPPHPETDIFRMVLTGETEEPPRLDALYDALSPDCFYLELQDRTTRCRDLWEHCGEDTLRGLFLRDLRQRYDAAPEEEKPRLLQAARFGLAALENREL